MVQESPSAEIVQRTSERETRALRTQVLNDLVASFARSTHGFEESRGGVFAIHLCHDASGNRRRAHCDAFVNVCAISETFGIHCANHAQDAAMAFRCALRQECEMRNFCARKRHRGSIWTRCHTSTATDASCASIARSASCLGTAIKFASGAEPTRAEMNPPGLHNPIQRATIDYQIFDNGERSRAKRLDSDCRSVTKPSHVKLAGCTRMIGTVCFAINGQAANAANTLTTIGIECDWLLAS